MSWRQCSVSGCRNMVREGLRRHGTGVDGQELADGHTCWQCRAKRARGYKALERADKKRKESVDGRRQER